VGPGQSSWYARALRLRHVRPGGLMSFLLFECVIAVAVLLALAELVSWWAVALLPPAVPRSGPPGSTCPSGGRRAAQAEAGVVEHPEWRQTITLEALGRHARDDHHRSTDIKREAGDARHRSRGGESAPFRLIYT